MFGDKFQGDIKLTEEQKKLISSGAEGVRPSTGWRHPWFKWPQNANGHVVMPYRIQESEGYRKKFLLIYHCSFL